MNKKAQNLQKTNNNPKGQENQEENHKSNFLKNKISKDTLFTIIILVLLAFATTFGYTLRQNAVEQKNIAQSFSNELNLLSPRIQQESSDYINSQKTLKFVLPTDPYYTPEGLYYIYGKDLYKLDPQLSYKLYDFYYNLTMAEHLRKNLIDNCMDYKKDTTIIRCDSSFVNGQGVEIQERILHASNDVSKIRPLLNKTIENWLAI